jgi:hypothetical protein
VTLDLTDNEVRVLEMAALSKLPNLRALLLARNPVSEMRGGEDARLLDPGDTKGDNNYSLSVLDLSYTQLQQLDDIHLAQLPLLEQLDLSHTPLKTITPDGFSQQLHLQQLNLKGCPLEDFSLGLFQNINELREVLTPNYRLCCPGILSLTAPTSACVADEDTVSSCGDLLRVKFYQVALVVISLVAMLGNAACVPIRLAVHKESKDSSFSILVTSLNAANLLMGVYCGIIAGADEVLRGSFVHEERAWTDSVMCRVAGFLYLLSTEVSAFTITLITWDRVSLTLFSLRGYRIGFGTRSSLTACVLVWLVGASLSLSYYWFWLPHPPRSLARNYQKVYRWWRVLLCERTVL